MIPPRSRLSTIGLPKSFVLNYSISFNEVMDVLDILSNLIFWVNFLNIPDILSIFEIVVA